MQEIEIWRNIPGFLNYQASTFGRIRSLDRIVRTGIRHNEFKKTKGRILKSSNNRKYQSVSVGFGKQKSQSVHRLVALTFIPNPDNKPNVCHRDDNPQNNRVDNLFWGTAQDNVDDKVSKGRTKKGSQLSWAKLKEADIPVIRELLRSGLSQRKVAKKFNCSKPVIAGIKNGLGWKHVV